MLHFAPKILLKSIIKDFTPYYKTADFYRVDCDYKVDMCNMNNFPKENFDFLIAFDVLEHVPSYQKALKEINRVLVKGTGLEFLVSPKGMD